MITDEQARAAVELVLWIERPHEDYWTDEDHAIYTLAQWAVQELSIRRTPPDDGPITAELRSILQGFDELAELWGDEAKFRRMRDRLRAVVQRGEQSENPGQLHVSRGMLNNIGPNH